MVGRCMAGGEGESERWMVRWADTLDGSEGTEPSAFVGCYYWWKHDWLFGEESEKERNENFITKIGIWLGCQMEISEVTVIWTSSAVFFWLPPLSAKDAMFNVHWLSFSFLPSLPCISFVIPQLLRQARPRITQMGVTMKNILCSQEMNLQIILPSVASARNNRFTLLV